MPLLDLRELLQFPGGDNSTDTVLNGVHFNLTALERFNYTIYDNGTISNRSKCYLIFDHYQPSMLSNGSWINGTSCYLPYYGIRTRAKTGIAFAALFTITIMFTLVNLRKHGRLFLREDKRFRVIGRRWQWYWMCFVAACGIISTITGIDVDRDYLQNIPIVLQGFFYCLMLPGTLAMVWEATRHWGSWQERQICDRDPFLLPQDDRRGKVEFFLPLIFYLFAWLNFFMTIPRSWTKIEYQRSPWQSDTYAAPSATDVRFKAGSILAVLAWVVTIVSLHHSLHHYRPRPTQPTLSARLTSFCHHCPTKLFLALIILGIRLAYAIASAWLFSISILNADVDPVWPYALGYGPTLLLLILFNVFGYVDENEDRILLSQRRDRGRDADMSLGYVKKPSWWSKAHGDSHLDPDQRLRALASENIGGGTPTARNVVANLELGNMRTDHGGNGQVRNRSRQRDSALSATEDPFSDANAVGGGDRVGGREAGGLRLPRTESDNGSAMTGETRYTGRTLTEGNVPPPQRIRSMLDV
ncbi:hypothetical protein K490DRAFT_44412 [Saccharata proteae CBS 121410]|uniref:Uncharacterized protein n=1 Tax=Saccharata proteae CBS 121410 TaxID=1314787 RepID=A0A9P4LUA6_9PEZI|nr:hypothetical protein K490DRAFT_44412 [Saccharata proteae CBS 121410]